jgi:hypothetical protein
VNSIDESTTVVEQPLIVVTDVLFMNNWAFGPALSGELLLLFGEHAPRDGRAVFICNPEPRHRVSEHSKKLRPLDLYVLPSVDSEVFDVPKGGIDWRHERGRELGGVESAAARRNSGVGAVYCCAKVSQHVVFDCASYCETEFVN